MERQGQWQRVVIQAVVIVVSILMAFGIQAWWDSRGEALQSRALIAALSEDFQTAGARLRTTRTLRERALLSAERLLTYVEEGSIPETERAQVDSVFSRLFYSMATFNPPMGTVETILSSGRLDLFQDQELVRELTRWTSAVDNYKEWETVSSDHFYTRVYPYLAARVNLQDLDIAVPWDVPWPHDPTSAADLISDAEFGSVLYMHYVLLHNVIGVFPQVETAISRISEITQGELAR